MNLIQIKSIMILFEKWKNNKTPPTEFIRNVVTKNVFKLESILRII